MGRADPFGLERVCSGSSNEHNFACVYVDGDGDGDDHDQDLSAAQNRSLASDFSGFILTNDGASLKNAGLPVSNGLPGMNSVVSKSHENFARAVSQFVGAAIGWDSGAKWLVYTNNDQLKQKYGENTWVQLKHAAGTSRYSGNIYLNSQFAVYLSKAGNMARVQQHENNHFSMIGSSELRVDTQAIMDINRAGLGSGGCEAIKQPGQWFEYPLGDGFPSCNYW